MCSVETLRGPVPCHELGATLCHEHVFVKNPELEENHLQPEWDEASMVATAAQGLESVRALGIATIVDLTVLGLGRSIPRIQRVAERTSLNIVAATGYYTKSALPSYFHVNTPGGLVNRANDPLAEMFLSDIREGMAGTGVKAAVLKVVTDREGVTPDVRRVLHAAAVAHSESGVPVFTHSCAPARTGLDQQEVLRSRGVDLSRVLIGHCDDTTDLDYLRELMDAGSTIGMDRFGLTAVASDEQRIDVIVSLCAEGYADRITLGHDHAFYSVNIAPSDRRRLWPEWELGTVSNRVIPELLHRGVSPDSIDAMMVRNPQRLLARH